MKATGIVRRMDDLGRVVIPKAGRVHRFVLCTTIANFYNFPKEVNSCLDYYNSRHIKAKRKGLPPVLYGQQALSAAQTIFSFNIV